MKIQVIAIVALLASVLGPDVAADTPQGEAAANVRAEHALCMRWLPRIRQQPGKLRTAGLDFAEMTTKHQPKWTAVAPEVYRELLNEWMFKAAARPLWGRSITREEAADLISRHLRHGTVAIWQSTVRFRRLPGSNTVTRIGLILEGARLSHNRPEPRDFAAHGYRYLISKGQPKVSDLYPGVIDNVGYLFLDQGFGVILNPGGETLLAPDVVLVPAGDRSTMILNDICYVERLNASRKF
ncbi:MAG: hypothetical protein J7500_07900 [Sphingomonas sp.]|uniref:hypothetical protein n=1 Tax=Sphingomonas sp. TaxID=28214 RepID=UPI001B1696D4|nr:hypothetical protein [Sphingomonas sp.]MBO9622620.1 hypothetical protein [Sphingomonas sp.]